MNLTKIITYCMVLGFLLVSLPVNAVQAGSLWSDNSSLYADHKARSVGDIVTIIINESSSAARAGNASNSKSTSTDMSAGTGIFNWIASANAANSDSFKAQGSIANTNKVNAKMTAQVIEVKPNGNFVISGTQSIKQNAEEQKITVIGTIRPDDIAADNTVLSTYVADAQIRIDGHGPLSRKQRQGILSQIFNILF